MRMESEKEKAIANSFSNAAYEESYHSHQDLVTGMKQNKRKRLYRLFVFLILVAISLGVGIGIGFVIGEEEATGGDFEPIVAPTDETEVTEGRRTTDHQHATTENGPTEPPPPADWIDMPCRDRAARCPAGISSPPLLLVSMDGLRADFLSRGVTPVLNRMAECGVSTPYMIPSFPTLTFPNHYSIVTGLYPESHGIVGNTMYNENGNIFTLSNGGPAERKWWGGEPIWNTARWQGKRSGAFFWPGSEADVQGIRPNYYNKYDGDLNYRQRLDTILGWLGLPDGYRPDVATLYFDEPDHTGHEPGPNTDEQNEVLAQMDGMMRRLMDGLLAMDMLDCVNIIVVADHGMANRTCDQTFILEDYMDRSGFRIVSTAGTMLRMLPEDSSTDLDEIVEELSCKHEVAIPYKKEDLPKRWHYANNVRIEPLEVTVPEQWTASGGSTTFCDGGMHGYDNLGTLMQAMFVGIGPGFKSQVEVEPFQNIELYNVMCELLDLDPAPNNGTMGSLHHMMRSPKPLPDVKPTPAPQMECSYPATESDYSDRLAADISSCQCSLNNAVVKTYDDQLDLSPIEVVRATNMHTPLGAPVMTFEMDYCQLSQNDYVTGYSHELRTPLWTSFTLQQPQPLDTSPLMAGCSARPDVRVPPESSASCSNYDAISDLTTGYLFPPALSSSEESKMDAQISSNIVPQYTGFISDIWDGFLVDHLSLWANISNEINVVTGPIFDFDYDGMRDNNDTLDKDGIKLGDSDTMLPTHYFMVVTRCKGGAELNSACAEIESAAFILRNTNGIKTCQSQGDYIEHNLATIRDIEKLTGLHMFPDVPAYESIQLKLYAPTKGNLWSQWPLMTHV